MKIKNCIFEQQLTRINIIPKHSIKSTNQQQHQTLIQKTNSQRFKNTPTKPITHFKLFPNKYIVKTNSSIFLLFILPPWFSSFQPSPPVCFLPLHVLPHSPMRDRWAWVLRQHRRKINRRLDFDFTKCWTHHRICITQ